ncbi:hypothetical protein FEMY_08350 [Ferrovum myxofaciens]|jgi:hypothetical protein|uniref:Uncharacterized protein n=2 Tax=Ferrovum myxofaciens TaxID=416213 RepID=A0A149VZL7_9PROT|nr:hypothetical protein FEMY_08350 [Ferrovum myxofaciens]
MGMNSAPMANMRVERARLGLMTRHKWEEMLDGFFCGRVDTIQDHPWFIRGLQFECKRHP